ncbi:MAG: DUF3089 domain-containing protein [Bacteroidales bacterium]|nr:DUF3089 domain-containing protein [Bacteroidales bacterium]MDD4670249.1 DUF3089 domain-containing protein [Bacteroidales bacterium]
MKAHSVFSVIIVTCIFMSAGCDNRTIPHKADYSLSSSWFEPQAMERGKDVDVFYIVPTCIWDSISPKGDTIHFMDIDNQRERNAVDPSIILGREAFSRDANFYSPYYRQISLESFLLDDKEIERRFAIAFEDISNAFDYYISHFNNGRPFILAGHSQGAKCVIELIQKKFDDEIFSRFVAGYIMGYKVTPQDTVGCTYLRPARGDKDLGVCISTISLSDTSATSGYLDDNCFIINPLNWHTDTTYADREQHLGAVFLNRDGSIAKEVNNMIGVKVDTLKHVLIVDGINPDDYYIPALEPFFKRGNYHIQEIPFYFRNLQENVKLRIDTYLNINSGARD